MKPDDKLVCELCSGEQFDEIYLPDPGGETVGWTGLFVCRSCRLVYAPRMTRPRAAPTGVPPAPDMEKVWLGS